MTPDSFSDGGKWDRRATAFDRGRTLAGQGADIVDVGGESTRPGAKRTPEGVERSRVLPVISDLAQSGIVVSVDTMRSSVAGAAVEAGASIINDVSGGLADPSMLRVASEADVLFVISHWRGHSDSMDSLAVYGDVVSEVASALTERCDAAVAAGISPERIIIDPGLGFAKRSNHNWALLAALPRLQQLGFPLLVGASRKRFLADACRDSAAGCAGRDATTHAISALAAAGGAWGVRVHEPAPSADAVRVASLLRGLGGPR